MLTTTDAVIWSSDVKIGGENLAEFKPLTFPFTKSGFTHELIKRDGLVCLVRRTRVGYPDTPAHYEVVRLRQAPERLSPRGEVLPAAEAYPRSEAWGSYGFTLPNV
jgi:hypothetical protein